MFVTFTADSFDKERSLKSAECLYNCLNLQMICFNGLIFIIK